MHELRAAPSWRVIELLSDVHLAPDMPATAERWARHMRDTDADAVFLLGDLFEVWVGDDARHDAFEARCVAALRDAASRCALYFVAGNRDFLVGDALLHDAGMTALPDPTVLIAFGTRTLLTHGDALCVGDVEYQRFRAQVRSPAWQQPFLALPLDERRAAARRMRDASAAHQRARPLTDIDAAEALRWLDEADAATLIHGHTHRPASQSLPGGRMRHVLADWDFDDAAAARGDVLRITAAGVQRTAA